VKRVVGTLFLIACILCPGGSAKAQSFDSGGYLALELQVSSLNKGLAYIVGLSGGYKTEDGTRFGLAIYDLLNGTPFPGQDPALPLRRTKMHWGGLIVAQEFAEESDWHPGVSLVLGGGDVSAYTTKKKQSSDQSWYWLLQPAVSIGYEVSTDYQPELGGGWRFPLGVNTPGTSNRLLGGPFASFNSAFLSL